MASDWPWRPAAWPRCAELHLWPWSRDLLRALPLGRIDWLGPLELLRLERLPLARRDDALRLRCAVRAALASYLDVPPQGLTFAYGDHGKPRLACCPDLQFSLSHTLDRALLAVSAGSPVGVDLERIRTPARDELAERVLGPRAWQDYRVLDSHQRSLAITHAWSEREALVKAIGLGIGDGWSLCRNLFQELPLVVASTGAAKVAGWHLRVLNVWPGFVGISSTAHNARLLVWQLPLESPTVARPVANPDPPNTKQLRARLDRQRGEDPTA